MISASNGASKARKISVWLLRIVLCALFLSTGMMKLTSQPMAIAEFTQIGLGHWFRYLTGGLEVLGAVALLVAPVSIMGAGLLLLVDVGALIAQVAVLHMDWVHTIVIGAFLALLILLQRGGTRPLAN